MMKQLGAKWIGLLMHLHKHEKNIYIYGTYIFLSTPQGKKLIYTVFNKIGSVIKVRSELNYVIRNLSYHITDLPEVLPAKANIVFSLCVCG